MVQAIKDTKPETIAELVKRHLMDESHIITNEEFQNAVILIPEITLENDSQLLQPASKDNR